MLVTNDELKALQIYKERKANIYKNKFLKRKYNHVNRSNIKAFYEKHVSANYSDKIFQVMFQNKFSIYLYLYLKSNCAPYAVQDAVKFNLSQPVKVNLSEISRLANIGRNTVKRALRELIQLGLVLELIPDVRKSHKDLKQVMVLNEYHLIGYDKANHKIIY